MKQDALAQLRKVVSICRTLIAAQRSVNSIFLLLICCVFCGGFAFALSEDEVLILVNENSATSKYVAKLYRQYHPDVPLENVVCLGISDDPNIESLPDCSGYGSGPEDEIIDRIQYNRLIAEPVREYLLEKLLAAKIKVIITTAGLPFRIEDNEYDLVVEPAKSSATVVSDHSTNITAASVESELTCLWHSDYGDNTFGLPGSMVNPYQGYIETETDFFERAMPGEKQFQWTDIYGYGYTPMSEGEFVLNIWLWPNINGTRNRSFHAGDYYMVCRLDGPKNTGQTAGFSAVFAVRKMLHRAMLASSPSYGVDPNSAVIVIDDSPELDLDFNRVYNIDGMCPTGCWDMDSCEIHPPDSLYITSIDDFAFAYSLLTGFEPFAGQLNIESAKFEPGMLILYDGIAGNCIDKQVLDSISQGPAETKSLLALCTYGENGDVSLGYDYLKTGGQDGQPLFTKISNGAVFTSIESFNCVTTFADAEMPGRNQELIVDFIDIGGTCAIGHVFEPISKSIVDNSYLLYNLFADNKNEHGEYIPDGKADLTFIEAAYSSIPFLSWSEVVIGDPLMRICYNSRPVKELDGWVPLEGDSNNDDKVSIADYWPIRFHYDGHIYDANNDAAIEKYNDLADLNRDGKISLADYWVVKSHYGNFR